MKRLILLSLALAAAMLSWADEAEMADFRVVCKDGTVTNFYGADTEITFSEDAAILYITEGTNLISYAVSGIEAIEFAQSGAYRGKYSYEGNHVNVSIDSADDTSYTTVNEVIPDSESDEKGDFYEHYKPTYTATITYNGDKATCSFSPKKPSVANVIVKGTHVTAMMNDVDGPKINYVLKGATTNGSFKLYSEKKAQITLSGVSITNPTGAAINIQSGKTMLVQLAEGTTNSLKDGSTYTLVEDEQQKGTFFSEGQLVFADKGTLNVESLGGHGIASDDYVRVRSGKISIFNTKKDGISTKECFIMYGGTLDINAGQDGIDVGEGYIEIGGGKINIRAVDEGITASYEGDEDTGVVDPLITPYINIKGGLIKVSTTGDKGHGIRAMSTFSMSGGIIQSTTKGAGSKALMSEGNMSLTGGKVTAITGGAALYEAEVKDLSSSAAIRSKGVLTITGTTVGVKSTGTGGKGINNAGDIVVKDSRVTVLATGATHKSNNLDSRSRGVSTDGKLSVDGGTLFVKSYDAPLHGIHTFSGNAVYGGYQIGE